MVNLADLGYNPANVQAQENDFKDIANGIYDAEVKSYEVVHKQNDPSKVMLNIVFKILGGEFDNREMYDFRCCLAGYSDKAIELGQRNLKALFGCVAGDESCTDLDALMNTSPFKIKVIQKGLEEYNGRESMKYNIYPQKPKGIQPAPAQTTTAPQAQATGNPTWGAPTAQDGNGGL